MIRVLVEAVKNIKSAMGLFENMNKGCFLTFEGIDGCGKSTQAKLLADALKHDGFSVVETREPGGTPISEKIRSLVLDPKNAEMVNECELLLYLAARAQHVKEKIIPALHNGTIVICDRFQDATFAYQGFGRGISLEFLHQINSFATGITPDKTFIFDISVENAFERFKIMNKSIDRLESSGMDFLKKSRQGYLALEKMESKRIVLFDGTLPIEDLSKKVYAIATEKMRELSLM
jgi:dTMP kinase